MLRISAPMKHGKYTHDHVSGDEIDAIGKPSGHCSTNALLDLGKCQWSFKNFLKRVINISKKVPPQAGPLLLVPLNRFGEIVFRSLADDQTPIHSRAMSRCLTSSHGQPDSGLR